MTAQQIIDVGVTENDGTGDSIQTSGSKINHNFSQLYTDNNIDGNILFQGNNITSNLSNSDIVLTASGTGQIQLAGIKINGTSMSSDDSASININENLQVDGTVSATTLFGSGAGLTGVTISGVGDISATGSTLISPSNADLTLSAAGTGKIVLDAITFDDNNITGTRSNDDINISPSGTGAVILPAITINDNNITGTRSNDDIVITPAGTGSIVFPAITINDNNIEGTRSNEDIHLFASLSGSINVTDITIDSSFRLKDNTITATRSNDDINLNANGTGSVIMSKVDIDSGTVDGTTFGATTPAAGTFTTVNATTLATTGLSITDNTITATQSNDNLVLDGNSSGTVIINGFTLPSSDGSSGQVLGTNGSKVLSFSSPSILLGASTIQDSQTTLSFKTETEIDHVTTTGTHELIQSGTTTINSFATSKYDSAFYLALVRDDNASNFEAVKVSLVHNNSDAFITESNLVKSDDNNYLTITADVNSGSVRLLASGASNDMNIKFYKIGLGDDDSGGYVAEDTTNAVTVINTDVDSAVENLDTFSASNFRGAKYFISINDGTKTELSNLECLVVHNGTDAFVNTYNIVNTGNNDLLTITADIDSGNVRLRASGNTPNLRVHMYRILLADNESTDTGTNVKIIGATTVSSSATAVDTFDTGTHQGAHYIFVAHNSGESGTPSSIQEVTAVSNGTTAFVSQGPVVSTKGTDQLIFTADHSGSTTTVKAASTSGSSTTVNGYRVALARPAGSATAIQTLDSFTASTFRSAKYNVQIVDTVGGNYDFFEVNLVHNGSTPFISTFARIGNSNPSDLVTISADIDSGSVRLRGTLTGSTNDHVITAVRRVINT